MAISAVVFDIGGVLELDVIELVAIGLDARREEQNRYHFEEMCDLIIYTHEEGIAKPDLRIFELACKRLGVQPSQMLFLDDSLQNIAAAHALGIHAIHCSETGQAIADVQACLRTFA